MPLSLSDILTNKAVVVFSYGEDTITVHYRPFVNDKYFYQRLARQVRRTTSPMPSNKLARLWWNLWHVDEQHICHWYLRHVIQSWDVTANGKPVSVRRGLKLLPALFVRRLYAAVANEVSEVVHNSIDEEIKKKPSAG